MKNLLKCVINYLFNFLLTIYPSASMLGANVLKDDNSNFEICSPYSSNIFYFCTKPFLSVKNQ